MMRDPNDAATLDMGIKSLIGYARVSTADQSLDMQVKALKKAGCNQVFTDVASGAKADRPGLQKALEYLSEGDTLMVWKLDRLGRTLPHLVQTVDGLRYRGVGFSSITEGFDTSKPQGKLMFKVIAMLAECERDLIRERTKASLAVSRARGRKGGRRAAVTPDVLARARTLIDEENMTVSEAAFALDVGRSTLYRALNAEGETPVKSDP